jgi:hypothetical protein
VPLGRSGGCYCCGGTSAAAAGTGTTEITSAGLVRTPVLNRRLGCFGGFDFMTPLKSFMTPLILRVGIEVGSMVGSGPDLFWKNLP